MRELSACLLMLCILMAGSGAWAQGPVAVVKTLKPDVYLERDGERMELKLGERVYPGDTIVTDSQGAVGVIFRDGAVLSLGPSSTFVLDSFLFAPEEEVYGFDGQILSGTASFLSGAMSRIAPEKMVIRTPLAIIGLRGTKVLIQVQ